MKTSFRKHEFAIRCAPFAMALICTLHVAAMAEPIPEQVAKTPTLEKLQPTESVDLNVPSLQGAT